MKKSLYILAAVSLTTVLASCGGSDKNKKFADSLLSKMKTEDDGGPGVKITFDQFKSDSTLDKKNVIIEGYVVMPSSFYTYGKTLSIDFAPRPNQFDNIMDYTVYLNIGSGNNTIKKLPEKYSIDDFKIKGDGGEAITQGDYVRITGKFSHGFSGRNSIQTVKIEKLDKPAALDYMALSPMQVSSDEMVDDSTNDAKLVYAEGMLSIPMFYYMTDDVSIDLKSGGKSMSVSLMFGSNPGQIEPLPDNATEKDLKVYDKNGKLIDPKKKVRVYGTIAYKTFHVESVEQL